jgi:diguanylate cyclase (GGDEF)-like protein
MLSAKTETADRVSAPDTGADAYLTKPFEAEELKAQIRAVLRTAENRRQAIYDALTGLFNRRAFDDLVVRGLSARERYGQELSLVAIDIDHFKAVNGTFGHDVGDDILRAFADINRNICRPSDLPCRWGGEEFVLLLPETGLEGANRTAERPRLDIETNEFKAVGTLTASLGVAQVRHSKSADRLQKRADEALYEAKNNGRNYVKLSPSA